MRVPGVKVWRAFHELDHLTDGECISVCRRVIAEMEPWRGRVPWVAGAVATLLAAAVVGTILHKAGALTLDLERIAPWALVVIVIILATAFAAGFVAVRDANLYLLIRRDIQRVRCRKCQQSLVGLKVIETALYPGTPGDARVRCPECGKLWTLLELGLTPRDLIPYEERVADQHVGKLKRSSRAGRMG
jgi:hypothetical protein